MNSTPYVHSGRLGLGLTLVPGAGLVVGLILGVVYAYANVYSPVAGFVSLALVFLLGFGVGAATGALGRLAKVRHAGAMHLLGLGVGLWTLYATWAAFVAVLLGRFAPASAPGIVDALISPGAVWELVLALNESGWYEVFGGTPKGGVLWLLWGVEALVVVGAVTIMAGAWLDDEVFCESCDAWTQLQPRRATLLPPADEESFLQIAEGSLEALDGLERCKPFLRPRIEVPLWTCPSCPETLAYRVDLVTLQISDEGEASDETSHLSGFHLATGETRQRLESLGQDPAPAEEDAAQEPEAEDEGDEG